MFCDGLYEYIGCDIEGFKHTLLYKLKLLHITCSYKFVMYHNNYIHSLKCHKQTRRSPTKTLIKKQQGQRDKRITINYY